MLHTSFSWHMVVAASRLKAVAVEVVVVRLVVSAIVQRERPSIASAPPSKFFYGRITRR